MCLGWDEVADAEFTFLVCDREGPGVDLDTIQLEDVLGNLLKSQAVSDSA